MIGVLSKSNNGKKKKTLHNALHANVLSVW